MTVTTPSARKTFVNLDFMRSVAVVLVALSHLLVYTGYGEWSGWSGITGVCIFFVHTTLVLMWSLERDPDTLRFYVRRAFRIYPLWLVVLGLTLLTRLPTSPVFAPHFGFFRPGKWELLANALLVFNFRFQTRVVGASWTLPLEVQMYLFLPCLFFFARTLRSIWPLLLLDGFIMVYGRTHFPATAADFAVCVAYFLPGVMAYVLKKRPGIARFPAWSFPVFLLTLVALAYRGGNFRRSWFFCLTLGLCLPLFHDMTAKPVRIIAHHVAKYSYGIYLSHIPAIGVSVYVLRQHSFALRIVAFFVLFTGLPVIFYHLVEEPMIRFGARMAGKLGRLRPPRIDARELELETVP